MLHGLLIIQIQKAETRDPQSKLVSYTSHISKLWIQLRDPASKNKVDSNWRRCKPQASIQTPQTHTMWTHRHRGMYIIQLYAKKEKREKEGGREEGKQGSKQVSNLQRRMQRHASLCISECRTCESKAMRGEVNVHTSRGPSPRFSSPLQPRVSLNKKAEVFLESNIFREAESISYHSGLLTLASQALPWPSFYSHKGELMIKNTRGHTWLLLVLILSSQHMSGVYCTSKNLDGT